LGSAARCADKSSKLAIRSGAQGVIIAAIQSHGRANPVLADDGNIIGSTSLGNAIAERCAYRCIPEHAVRDP